MVLGKVRCVVAPKSVPASVLTNEGARGTGRRASIRKIGTREPVVGVLQGERTSNSTNPVDDGDSDRDKTAVLRRTRTEEPELNGADATFDQALSRVLARHSCDGEGRNCRKERHTQDDDECRGDTSVTV